MRRAVERLLPDRQASRDGWRVRFIHAVHLIGALVGTCMAATYLAFGMRASAALTLVLAVALGWRLRSLVRGDDPTVVTRGSLLIALLCFAGYVVTERPFDPVMFLWFGLVPYLGTTMLGPRSALPWLAATVVCAVAARLVVAFELWPPLDVHHGGLASNFRAITFSGTLFLFVLQFERERQRSLAAVEAAAQLKSRFLANMSHEIRTPMNGILGMTEALLLGPLEPQVRESLEVIGRSGRSLVALLNDLLDVSKIEAGKLALEARPMDLAALLADLQALQRPLAQQKGLTFTLSIAPTVPTAVVGDALRLRQVLGNLVGNAVKFTAHGEVSLEVRPVEGGALRFEVRDTGIGIAADVVPRLFSRFQQADSSTTRQFGGSGLGLALSRELVALMGGRLEVDSSPGAGSRFWFEVSLPTAEPAAQALVPPAPVTRSARGPVLVVDDNEINCTVAARLLAKLNVEVLVASNGVEAVARADQGGLRLVLMDCHMPEMDGFEATRRIRALTGARGRVPIVALTASAMPDELAACLAAGMDDTISKPVTLEALAAVLSKV